MIAQQKLSAVFGRARRYDSDLDRVGIGQVDRLLVVVGCEVRGRLSTTHRHTVTARRSLLDHSVHLLTPHAICTALDSTH